MSDVVPARLPAPPDQAATAPATERDARRRWFGEPGGRAWSSATLPGAADRPSAGHAFGRVQIQGGAAPTIQTRLAVGQPDDPHEVEAERAADSVLAAAPHRFDRSPAESHSPSLVRPRAPGSALPAPTGHVQARVAPGRTPTATPDLADQIAGARTEGQPLPADQRDFYEERLGHDFGAVRVHTGPASAAAAAAVGAQAFTHGQDIYFGAGYYRPESAPGQRLMAHELAHTVQQRPNVIARQPLEAPAPPAELETPGATVSSGESVELLATDLLGVLHSGSARGNNPALERLRALDVPTQLAVLARVRSYLPPSERPSVATLFENAVAQRTGTRPAQQPSQTATESGEERREAGTASRGGSDRTPGPGDRAAPAVATAIEPGGRVQSSEVLAPAPSAPAPSPAAETPARQATGEEPRPAEETPVQLGDGSVEVRPAPAPTPAATRQVPEAPPSGSPLPTERSARSTAVAAAAMQAAVRSATEEAGPSEASSAPAAEEGEARGAGMAGSTPEPGQAEAAAQVAVAAFNDQLAVLGQIRGGRVRFGVGQSSYSSDPAEISRREQSESLASGFIAEITQRVEPIIAGAVAAVPQMLASLAGAKETISRTVTEQVAAVHEGAETARKRVSAQARQTRGQIERKRGESDSATDRGAQKAQDRAKSAQKTASGEIDKQAKTETDNVSRKYRDAAQPTRQVGANAGNEAAGVANAKAREFRSQKNGESSILDGPIHDNRLEAKAETAIKVAAEYSKSFRESADDQANKLPESKPEVVSKISEISGQAKTGLDDQLKQMTDGISGFSQSAHARAKQTNNRLQSAAKNSATQTMAALTASEEQITTDLVAQGAAQQQAQDEAVATSLASLTDGLTQAIGSISQSMAEFTSSAAVMAPPDPEELRPVLSDVTGQTSAAVATMGQQIETVAPTMEGTLATARDQTARSLAEASAAAREHSGATAEAFTHSMKGLNRQATRGFDALIEADTKTADSMGQNAEKGFREASEGSKKAFGLFGEKVDENLRQGREQLFNSLWSKQNQEKLDADIDKYGKEAAARVQPRWKKVLKWVVTIVVVIAVIAITVVSAGSLGPVGVVLLGATLGAAAGAATTIAHNLIDGKKWSDGVAKAMIVGAVGGAFGGAGGLLVKGIGSTALRIGLEAGINVAGGITGEVVGSVAVGESINWTGAVVGALIGAGVGAGLGIAGALKGRISLGSAVDVPPPVRPAVEVLPPPAGRVRTVLEQARILAPRRAPAVPEGAAATTAESAPTAGPEPRIGFGPDREAARAAQPRPPGAQPQTERVGFGREGVREAQPRPLGAEAQPEPRIGVGREGVREAQPRPPGAEPRPEPRIGFGREGVREAQPRPPGAEPQPEPRIGFGREGVREAQPRPPGAEPRPEPRIGFGPEREAGRAAQPRPPVSQAPAGPEGGLPADVQSSTAAGRPVSVEAGAPRPSTVSPGGEPVTIGGQVPEILASARPGGGGGRGARPTSSTPDRGKVTPVEETPPAPRPAESGPAETSTTAGGPPGTTQRAPRGGKAAPARETPPARRPAEPAPVEEGPAGRPSERSASTAEEGAPGRPAGRSAGGTGTKAPRPGTRPGAPEAEPAAPTRQPEAAGKTGSPARRSTSEEIREELRQTIEGQERTIRGGGEPGALIGEGDPTTQLRTHSRTGKPPSPSPGRTPKPFERGNFVHRFAEFILGRRIPARAEPEVTVEVSGVTKDTIRIDRLVRGQGTTPGEVIEIRPVGPQADRMARLINGRVAAVQREIPHQAGYTPRVVTYTPEDVLAYLIGVEGLSRRRALAVMRIFGFDVRGL